MGAKKRAGVSEGFQGGPKRIAILADMVDGSKFFDLEEEQAPVHVLSEAQTWFHFQKAKYYPLVILENEKPSTQSRDKKVEVQFSIERIPDDLAVSLDSYQTKCKPVARDIYYFQVPLINTGGSYKICFRAVGRAAEGLEIEPIEHVIAVPFNASELKIVEAMRGGGAAAGESEGDLFDESAAAGWAGPPAKRMKGGKAAGRPSSSSSPHDNVTYVLDDAPATAASVDAEALLPMPLFMNLTTKSRLQRRLLRGTMDIGSGKMNVFLENSHLVALLDDRAAQAALSEHAVCGGAAAKASPSVNDIFAKVCASHRLKELSKEGPELVEQLRLCFEYSFEANVLYSAERKRLRKVLRDLEASQTTFGDVFGSTHLLRFLVFFVTAADPDIALAPPQDPLERKRAHSSSAAGEDRRSSRQQHAEAAEECAGSPSRKLSQLRTREVADRQHSKGLYLLGQVIVVILREMDDLAPWYFA